MAAPAFAKVPTAAFMDRRLGARDLRLLGVLYAHANSEMSCWPSVTTLVELTGIDRRDVQRSLKRLVEFDWLTIQKGGGRSSTSLYTLRGFEQTAGDLPTDKAVGEAQPAAPKTEGSLPAVKPQKAGEITMGDLPAERAEKAGDLPLKGGCFTPETVGDLPAQNIPRTDQEQLTPSPAAAEPPAEKKAKPQKPKSESSKAAQQVAFDRFWATYPKRRGKADARKAWDQLAPDDALLRQILVCVEQARNSPEWRKDGGQFIPHPATWLRRRGWEDEWHVDIEPLNQRQGEGQRIDGTISALSSLFGGQDDAATDVSARHGVSGSSIRYRAEPGEGSGLLGPAQPVGGSDIPRCHQKHCVATEPLSYSG